MTILKAFFDTTDENGISHAWPSELPVYKANADGSGLVEVSEADKQGMTIGGELNKLAANISIGRNMGGVHYYTDYYESLRMGERVATGMLIEQMKHYNEPVEFSFESFDGDHIHILKQDFDYSEPRVYVTDSHGRHVELDAWWQRHTSPETESAAVIHAHHSTGSARLRSIA